jgi:hypothetical protein
MIIVDDLQVWGRVYRSGAGSQAERVGAKNGDRWCHLSSTPDDEDFSQLHRFAAQIGMRRTWFQGDHYDLVPGRRDHAVRLGATQVTRLEMSMVLLYDRKGRKRPDYGTPDKTTHKALREPLEKIRQMPLTELDP